MGTAKQRTWVKKQLGSGPYTKGLGRWKSSVGYVWWKQTGLWTRNLSSGPSSVSQLDLGSSASSWSFWVAWQVLFSTFLFWFMRTLFSWASRLKTLKSHIQSFTKSYLFFLCKVSTISNRYIESQLEEAIQLICLCSWFYGWANWYPKANWIFTDHPTATILAQSYINLVPTLLKWLL